VLQLKFFAFSQYNPLFLTFMYSVYEAVSLGNRYWTLRDSPVDSYSSVDNINNISLHDGVFASLFRNVDNKLHSDTASNLNSKDTECS
jgi:hypothetical protein